MPWRAATAAELAACKQAAASFRALTMAFPWSMPNAFPMSPPPNMAAGAEAEGPGLRSECERSTL